MTRHRSKLLSQPSRFISLTLVGFLTSILQAGDLVPIYGRYFGELGDASSTVAVAVKPSGEIIIAGYTTSQTLPGTSYAFQPMKATGFPDNRDVFVAEFDKTGDTLLWSTFLGGDDLDQPQTVAVDSSGNIYIAGPTRSSTFPTTPGAYARSISTPAAKGFVAKVSSDGRSLLYSTYLPGIPNAMAVSDEGEAYLVGPFSPTAITDGALGSRSSSVSQGNGVSLLRLNSSGSDLVFGAYLGGEGFNGSVGTSVAIDPEGNAYVGGFTAQSSIPTTGDALQRQYSNPGTGIPCCSNGFILKIDPTGSELLYGTYFGPKYFGTVITSIALGSNGSIYFSGSTNATSFGATAGAYRQIPAPGFIARLTPGSSVLDAFSYIPSVSANPSGPSPIQSPILVAIGDQPKTVFLAFRRQYEDGPGFDVLELSTPKLALVSSYISSKVAFNPFGLALSESAREFWLVGGCYECSLTDSISTAVFQDTQLGNNNGTLLLRFAEISPMVSFVGNAANGASPFAAGQLISVYGSQLGPSPGSGAEVDQAGSITKSNGGTKVFFDGVAAPILYAGANQVNAVIPCSMAGRSSAQLVVSFLGAQSPPLSLSLEAAAPGIFTSDGSGKGQAAALNQDYTLNGPANPAARGSAITFYATGIGVTSPCVDGQTYQTNFPTPTLSVVAGVGNSGAQILYAGQAPYFVSGVAQINITIPSDAPTGIVPLTLLVGGVFSPPGVTIAVK